MIRIPAIVRLQGFFMSFSWLFIEKGVPLYRVCAKYHVSRGSVQRWTRMYRKGGYDALRTIKKPRKSKNVMGRPTINLLCRNRLPHLCDRCHGNNHHNGHADRDEALPHSRVS